MMAWSKMSRDERTAAIAAVRLTTAEALRLARLHGTAAAAILSHAARSGIAVVDDATANDGQPPADAGRREKPSTGKRLPDQTEGGDHEVTQRDATKAAKPATETPVHPQPASPSFSINARHHDYAGAGWTEARIAALPEQLGQGLSAADIAATLGGDLSRNAVISKVNRLGLSLGKGRGGAHRRLATVSPSPKTTKERLHQARQPKPKTEPRPPRAFVPKPRPEVPEPVSLGLSLLQLGRGQCKYPSDADDIADVTFCGAPQFAERPYCEFHSRIAYIPAAVRDRTDRRLGLSP